MALIINDIMNRITSNLPEEELTDRSLLHKEERKLIRFDCSEVSNPITNTGKKIVLIKKPD